MLRCVPRSLPQLARRSVTLAACALTIFLAGCSGFGDPAEAGSIAIPSMAGSVHGGQQPIVGSHVYLYAANKTAYNGAATSLMTVGASGTATDGNGVAYVTSGAAGAFSITGDYANCTSGTQVYLLATGGIANGVAGPSNAADVMAAALGDCVNLTTSTFITINEVTTVAAAYALQGFMTDPTHVGAKATNLTGLANAFTTANSLVSTASGQALTTTPGVGNGVVPQTYINTLGNIIAACVNSASGSSACTSLFAAATPSGGSAPTDTFGALLNVAAQPASQVANLYALSSALAPFQPALTSQPNDFSLGVSYTPTGITNPKPGAIVIDGSGNIWTTNCQTCTSPSGIDTLLQFNSAGALLHSYNGSASSSTLVLHSLQDIALDAGSTNIYTINQGISGKPSPGTGDDQLIKIVTSTGLAATGFPVDFDQSTYGVRTFYGVALDNSGQIWATATNTGAIIQMSPAGNLLNGSPFFVGGTLGVATDNSGNIWFAGNGGNNLIQFDTFGDFLQNFTPSGLNIPYNMAIDSSSNLWTINTGNKSLSHISSTTGANLTGSPFTNLNINTATKLAIDGTGRLIIPNCRVGCTGSGSTATDNLIRTTSAGILSTGGASGANAGVQASGTFSNPTDAAIDSSGNVWVTNRTNGKLTKLIGFASPTIQPLAAASSAGKIGTLP